MIKNKFLQFIKKNKSIFIVVFFVCVFGVFGVMKVGRAGLLDMVWNPVDTIFVSLVGGLVQMGVWICGAFITVIVWAVTHIAKYNNFINENAIVDAWKIIRDFCNMFFILILLLIAFATILRIESYKLKTYLPKLLIMAVLINFSKTICGLFIDFGQVVMMTFVGAIGDTGGNYLNYLGVDKYLNMVAGKVWDGEINLISTIGGMIAGIIFMLIAMIVLIIILGVLVMRIVMLWIYIVLSPLAFLLSAFPQGQKYASQWWSEFSKQVIVGPVLLFFVWLSLVATESIDSIGDLKASEAQCFGPAGILCPDEFVHFVVAIGMLIGGLIVAQQIGGATGSLAGKGLGWAKKAGTQPWNFPGIKQGLGFGVDKLHQKSGIDLNLKRVWGGVQVKRQEKRNERYAEGMQKARDVMAEGGTIRGMLAMTGSPGAAWDQITSVKGIKQRILGGKRMAKKRYDLYGDLEQAKFEENYARKSKDDRRNITNDLTRRSYEVDDELSREKDDLKKETLKAEKVKIDKRLEFARENMEKDFSDTEKDDFQKTAEEKQNKFSKYVPTYDFQARAVEQKVVNEKASQIKDITDGDELLRILRDAIKSHDKAMVKAITKKMASNGDDNEFLKAIAGRTDAVGLQKFAQILKNKAGFTEQESFALGSEISNINKNTNHWAATGAFTMQNGMWRESSGDEIDNFRSVEVGKVHPQAIIRSINRLGYGFHDSDGTFHLDKGGLDLLKKLDNEGSISQIKTNMNESAAKHLLKYVDTLKDSGAISENLMKAIKDRVGEKELSKINSTTRAEANEDLIKLGAI